MTESRCKNCVHYRQHYILDRQRGAPVKCGHCVFPRLKHRKPDTKACINFEPAEMPASLPDRGGVIHFLTTDFLQYILSLELPPQLEE